MSSCPCTLLEDEVSADDLIDPCCTHCDGGLGLPAAPPAPTDNTVKYSNIPPALLRQLQAKATSLIALEASVQDTKLHVQQRLSTSLSQYDALIDGIITSIEHIRTAVKAEVAEVCCNTMKRLDAQSEELAVSIGQLQGLITLVESAHQIPEQLLLQCKSLLLSKNHVVTDPKVVFEVTKTRNPNNPATHVLENTLQLLRGLHVEDARMPMLKGNHVATLPITDATLNSGIAVNADATLMAVSNGAAHLSKQCTHMITLYRLPSGDKIVSFGGIGSDKGQYNEPNGLCFTVDGMLIVAEKERRQLQEVTHAGVFVRFYPETRNITGFLGVAANDRIVVGAQACVSRHHASSHLVTVFDYATSAVLYTFGPSGYGTGTVIAPRGVIISPDDRFIYIVDKERGCISQFTIDGAFIRLFTKDSHSIVTSYGAQSGCCLPLGEVVTPEGFNKTVTIFPPEGGRVLMRIDQHSFDSYTPVRPVDVDFAAGRLYILDADEPFVYVFERACCCVFCVLSIVVSHDFRYHVSLS